MTRAISFLTLVLLTVPTTVSAAAPVEGEASGSLSLSTDAGADGEASASGAGSDDGADTAKKDKWIHKWAPENHMGEVGIYGGVFFPARRLELFDPDLMQKDFSRAAADIGLRAGYYPLRFFGIEAEGGVMPTKTVDDQRATVWTVRGHVVGQLGLWSVTPFLVAGVGALGVGSGGGAVGKDTDVAIHWGPGVKFFINRWIMLRLDGRHLISNRSGVGRGVISSGEILLGLSVTLGRKKNEAASDKDGDGVPDWRDRCDEVPGPAPTGCPDRDGDGVFDHKDQCPDVPGEKPSGCPPDRDGDGFIDTEDKCPDVPGVAPDGCPSDRDKDGIFDEVDACPDEPETKNGYDDQDGCPDEVPDRMKDFAGVIKGILFDLDKDTIKSESRPVLDAAVEVLQANPEVTVEIVGHTDSTGSRTHNMELSRRRAEAVKRYLVKKGVDGERISTRGAGPDEPIADNTTDEGRAKNRRIEFNVATKKGQPKIKAQPSGAAPARQPTGTNQTQAK